VGSVGVLNEEGLKIKSCKGDSGNKGWKGRVLVCPTFSRHLSDEFHLDALQGAAVPRCGLFNAFSNSVSVSGHGRHITRYIGIINRSTCVDGCGLVRTDRNYVLCSLNLGFGVMVGLSVDCNFSRLHPGRRSEQPSHFDGFLKGDFVSPRRDISAVKNEVADCSATSVSAGTANDFTNYQTNPSTRHT